MNTPYYMGRKIDARNYAITAACMQTACYHGTKNDAKSKIIDLLDPDGKRKTDTRLGSIATKAANAVIINKNTTEEIKTIIKYLFRLFKLFGYSEDDVIDLNYIAELRGKKSKVNINVQGALKDKAKKNFKGIIDFKKGCKKAVGSEEETCTLLSDTAKALALPMLLCSEEDVEGNHATSAGKIDNKQLFYIMSRGFSVKEAQKLIVRAKFNKILENICDEELTKRIEETINNRLD